MHTSNVRHQIIHPLPGLYITPPPPTNELLLFVPEQMTETTFTYLPNFRQLDALDYCYSLQNGSYCPRVICSAALPHHRSIALSHQSFRRCRTDELLLLVIQTQHWESQPPPPKPLLPSH